MFKTNQCLRNDMKTDSSNRPFVCDYSNCQYKSLNKHCLIQHKERVHSNRRLYKCTFSGCESTFKTSGNLYNHLYSHKSGPQFKCHFPDCDYSTTNVIRLRRYKNYRHRSDGKMFSCDWPDVNMWPKDWMFSKGIYAFIRENVIMAAIDRSVQKGFK